MSISAAAPRPTRAEPVSERVDAGGDVVSRALRLGSKALDCGLSFQKAEKAPGAGRERRLPLNAFAETAPVLAADGSPIGEVCALRPASSAPFDWEQASALSDVAALIASDVAARERIGLTDHVTGFANRRSFERDFERITESVPGAACLVLVTLAEAKRYNDILRALGHACTETFVQQGGARVRDVSGAAATYHVSVLSFAFVCWAGAADRLARACVDAFAAPLVCDGLPIATRVGVGVTPLDRNATKPSEVLRSALAAAQDSRGSERGYAFYDRRSDEAHRRTFRLLSDLGEALRDYGQLALAYQPRVDLRTSRTIGGEALIRWTHPTLGPVSPGEFVPLAETTALIEPLTDWVLTRTCRQSSAWRRAGLDLKLSVNVSPASLHDGDFLGRVAGTLEDVGTDPSRIELEFTEGVLASSEAGVRAKIDAIRASGVTVAIDDFGTGYANLDYLTRLPADVLKIDRSFMRGIDADARRGKLVRSMIEMGQDLGFRIVAEGVETAAVYDMLAKWGCDEGQGYYMARPLSAEDFAAFAAAR